MQIRIIGKHIKINARMREHIEQKLEKLAKFTTLIEAQVVLKVEKYLYISEITLLGKEVRFYGEGRSEENFFVAFDTAEQRVLVQLKKKKEKIKNHHKILSRREVAEYATLGAAASARPAIKRQAKKWGRVIRESLTEVRPMSVEDAQMELGDTNQQFLVFQNSETKAVNVLYRRKDGNFGLIESEG